MEVTTWEEYIKQENEMNLFGFTINDFKRENFFFFRSQVVKSMKFMNEKFMELTTDAPDLIKEVANYMRMAEKNVLKSCEPSIKNIVNNEVERCLKIPQNIILPSDRSHFYAFTDDEIDDLEKECDELRTIVAQNTMFLKCLTDEIDSYKFEKTLKQKQMFLLAKDLFGEK